MESWTPGYGTTMPRWMGWLAPGIPQLLGGRPARGAAAALLWVALLVMALVRRDRVLAAFSGGLDERIALLTLVGSLALLWWWSFRDGRREADSDPGCPGAAVPGSVRVGPLEGNGWRVFMENRLAVLGVGLLVAFYLALLLTPFLAPYGPEVRSAYQPGGDMAGILAPPSSAHLMGTDQYSQDVFSRLLYGARISLTIGLIAVGISVGIGTILGAMAGFLGGFVDGLIMRSVDVLLAFPRLVLLIAIVALFPLNFLVVVVALAFTQWPFTARMVRGEVLALREREFATAARALGFSRRRILFRHLLPNAMGPIIVLATLGVGNAIVLEAALSFLGLGVQAGVPSWGAMVAQGQDYLTDAWWIGTFPGLAIVLVVLAFNLVGDGLRDALDPRQGERSRP